MRSPSEGVQHRAKRAAFAERFRAIALARVIFAAADFCSAASMARRSLSMVW